LSGILKVGLACINATAICIKELTKSAWVVTEVVASCISSVNKNRWAGIDIGASSVVEEGLIGSARVVTEYVASLSEILKVGLACVSATAICIKELTRPAWVVTEVVAICVSSVPESIWAHRNASSVVEEGLIGSARVVTEYVDSLGNGLPDCWAC